jgi:hypothetical protein
MVLLATGTVFAGESILRGRYFRNAEFGFELWIPQGFTPRAGEPLRTSNGVTVGRFRGRRSGVFSIHLRMFAGDTIEEYSEAFKNEFSCRFEVHERLTVGGRTAVVFSRTALDDVEGFRGTELAEAGIMLDGQVLRVVVYCKQGHLESGLKIARWMVGMVRLRGEDGLDPWLGARRVDPETGLSWRPPVGWTSQAVESAIEVLAGDRAQLRIALTRTRASDPAAALKTAAGQATRRWGPTPFPNDHGLEMVGVGAATADGSVRVLLAAGKSGNEAVFLLTAEGGNESEDLLRQAELVGMSLRWIDVASMRSSVAAAIQRLRHASSTNDTSAVHSAVAELAKGAFLKEAADALVDAMPRLESETLLVQVARALRATDPERVDELVRLAKDRRIRGNEKVVTALLDSIGEVEKTSIVLYLVRQVRSAPWSVAAAAVRALGRANVRQERIAGDLIRQIEAHERAAARGGRAARQRALYLWPAFQQALRRLTGQSFASAETACAWWRARR